MSEEPIFISKILSNAEPSIFSFMRVLLTNEEVLAVLGSNLNVAIKLETWGCNFFIDLFKTNNSTVLAKPFV